MSGGQNGGSVEAAEKVLATAQRAFDAEPSIETAMLLDGTRRRLYLARREARGQEHDAETGFRDEA